MSVFLDILKTANKQRWCVTPNCTTCGSMEFRRELRSIGMSRLSADLASLDLTELRSATMWREALRLALDALTAPRDKDAVLLGWLPQLDRHIPVADLVLFYFVRQGAFFAPMSIEVLSQWKKKCLSLALQSKDESLVESLLYTVGRNPEEEPGFESVALSVAATSPKVNRALTKARS